nr:DMT family transporter [Bacteroidota bacterium]
MKQQGRAYFFAIFAILLWSTVGSALKIGLRYISFPELLFWASVVSIIIFSITILAQGKLYQMRLLRVSDFVRAAILGFLNPFLYYFVLLKAYNLLLAQEAGTLNYIWPVVLVLLSIPLLKQKIGWVSILAIFISFSGTMVIGTRGKVFELSFSNPLGVGLALLSALFWAIFWIYNMKDRKDDTIKLLLNFVFGFLYILIYLIGTSGFSMISIKGLTGAVYIGLFEMGVTYMLWLKALKLSATTAKISNLVFISPFISLFFIRYAVGEMIMISTVIGLALIVGGIILQKWSEFSKSVK